MISTDRNIFTEGSAVRARQIEYAKQWDEVHIVIFETAQACRARGSREVVLAPNCWAYSTSSAFKLKYSFDAMKIGRVIVPGRGITNITCQDASLTAMAGISLKKQFHIPLEIQVHEDLGSPKYAFRASNKLRRALALSYLPKADHIRVVSNKIKNFLVDSLKIDAGRVEVRPIMIDTERIRNAPIIPGADLHKKYPQFEVIVLMAGRLEKEKNFILGIRAWKEVVKKLPKAGLVILGSGSEKDRLKKIAKELGLAGSSGSTVVFEDWIGSEVLISYYKTADLFLNTSLFEGYGMTLVEATAAGCTIISTDVGVAREVGATIVDWTPTAVASGVIGAIGSTRL